MKQTINFSQFIDAFQGSQYEHNFTYEGKKALFDYLENYEEETGEEIELDIVALCCDYTEFENLEEAKESYNIETIEELQDNTIFIPIYDNNGIEMDSFIIQDY